MLATLKYTGRHRRRWLFWKQYEYSYHYWDIWPNDPLRYVWLYRKPRDEMH